MYRKEKGLYIQPIFAMIFCSLINLKFNKKLVYAEFPYKELIMTPNSVTPTPFIASL